ncbi:MAG: cation diffusion facilitator family transporter [Candidatus Omnitrophica bacterium]|nr:cation diffusion facilitator family transporter [Candidatus Omnitrophota bacterium]
MRLFTHQLLKIFVKNYEDIQNPEIRVKYGFLEAKISIILNLFLSLAKFTLGIFSNSIALMADAFHTFSDVVTSVVVWVGFKASRRPADEEHPFGHGRIEPISTLIIGVLMAVAGFHFLKDSFMRILYPQQIKGDMGILIFLVISAYLKEELAIFAEDLGKKIKGESLLADAWHHRTDALASLLIVFSIIAVYFGYLIVDSVLGMLISALIILVGIKFIYRASNRLIGYAPSKEVLNKIREEAYKVEGVKNIHDIEIHEYGEELRVSLHIKVNPNLRVDSAHRIANEVENKLKERLRIYAIVHIDPL